MAEGLMHKEIAAKMSISGRMVKQYCQNLRMKAGVNGMNNGALMAWAFRNKLVK
jgi:DNA-binding NarL/FixJ family response regulator